MSEEIQDTQPDILIIKENILKSHEFAAFIDQNAKTPEEKILLTECVELLLKGIVEKKPFIEESDNPDMKKKIQIPKEHLLIDLKIRFLFKEPARRLEFLIALFRLSSAYAIQEIIRSLNSTNLANIFLRFQMLDLDANFKESVKETHRIQKPKSREEILKNLENIYLWRKVLNALTQNNSLGGQDTKPFLYQFGDISADQKDYAKCMQISSHFGHALTSTFNIDAVLTTLQSLFVHQEELQDEDIIDDEPSFIYYQAHAKNGFVRLLEGYKTELLSREDPVFIHAWGNFLMDIVNLLNARVINKTDENVPLPISFNCSNALVLNSVDENAIFRAVFEIAKNALTESKLKDVNLHDHNADRNPYLEIIVNLMLDSLDNEAVKIQIRDRGASIKKDEIQDASGRELKSWVDVMDVLATPSFSHSDKKSGSTEKHSGIGLATAREIVRAHNGDISCRNLGENQGVLFEIVIPIEGKKSAYSYRYLRNTDTNKDSLEIIYGQRAITAETQEAVETVIPHED